MNEIKNLITGAGIALEQKALQTFSTAVTTVTNRLGAAVSGALSSATDGFFSDPNSSSQSIQSQQPQTSGGTNGVWDPAKYAAALVKNGQVDFNPKLKFLFKVSFEFDVRLTALASALGHDLKTLQENATFMVVTVDRPKFEFVYEEVNMYNYKTKVLKSTGHREVGLTMYDDIGNNVIGFFNVYRKLLMPIARREMIPTDPLENFGFDMDQSSTSMRALLPEDAKSVLTKMTIHQIFVERGSTSNDPASWVKMIDFVFLNPRFTNVDLDDMDHANGGNYNAVTATVDFDTMFMSEPVHYSQDRVSNFPAGDIPANSNGSTSQAGGNRNPDIDALTFQGVSNPLNDVNVFKGMQTSGLDAGSFGDISFKPDGILASAAKNTLQNVFDGKVATIARIFKPAVADNSVASSTIAALSRVTLP